MKEAIVFDEKWVRRWRAQAAVEEFNRHAVAGDFSQVPVAPKRREKISGSRVRAGESK